MKICFLKDCGALALAAKIAGLFDLWGFSPQIVHHIFDLCLRNTIEVLFTRDAAGGNILQTVFILPGGSFKPFSD